MPRILTQAHVNDFRNRLCDVAVRLYSEVGQDGFNMRDLASRLGVSAMTPYRYFRDKNEILAVVRARCFKRLAETLENAAHAPNTGVGCIAVLEAYTAFALDEPANYRLIYDLSQPVESLPELLLAEARARQAFAAAIGAVAGTDNAEAVWTTLHGALALHLCGKLSLNALNDLLTRTCGLLLGVDHVFDVTPRSRMEAVTPALATAAE